MLTVPQSSTLTLLYLWSNPVIQVFRYHSNSGDSQIYVFSLDLVPGLQTPLFNHSLRPFGSLIWHLKLNMSKTEALISPYQCSSLNKWYHHSFIWSSQKSWSPLWIFFFPHTLHPMNSSVKAALTKHSFWLLATSAFTPRGKPAPSLTHLPSQPPNRSAFALAPPWLMSLTAARIMFFQEPSSHVTYLSTLQWLLISQKLRSKVLTNPSSLGRY